MKRKKAVAVEQAADGTETAVETLEAGPIAAVTVSTTTEKAAKKAKAPKTLKAITVMNLMPGAAGFRIKSAGKKASKAAKKPAAKKAAKPAPKKTAATRGGTKAETMLDLLRQKGGATLGEIMKATGWQAHSVRGFISAHVGKKLGLTVDSTKNEAGERTYQIAK